MKLGTVFLAVAAVAGFVVVRVARGVLNDEATFPREAAAIVPPPFPPTASKGADSPLVRIVQFGTFSCGPCVESSRLWNDVVGGKLANVRVEYRYLNSRIPAWKGADEAVFAGAESGKFWQLQGRILQLAPPVTPEAVLGLATARPAGEASLPGGVFLNEKVASSLAVTALPTVFVNGRRIQGLVGKEVLARVLREEMAHARARIAARPSPRSLEDALLAELGTSRDKVSLVSAGEETCSATKGPASVKLNRGGP